jgi:hypothetical protein
MSAYAQGNDPDTHGLILIGKNSLEDIEEAAEVITTNS